MYFMKNNSVMNKRILNTTAPIRILIWLTIIVIIIWFLSLVFLNKNQTSFSWFLSDINSLRALFGSLFQGLASFFAIVISVTLLVAQLAYGSFSPRIMPNFLRDSSFLSLIFLFITALCIDLVLLLFLTENTLHNFFILIVLGLFLSITALISVVPVSFMLLRSAHPMKIAREVIDRFNDEYFKKIDSSTREALMNDGDLPLIQSLIVKALRDADTDYAMRLLGSFEAQIIAHLNDDNAVNYSNYFSSFFKKIIFVASQENEESVLEQMVFMNEAFETKVIKSNAYLSNSDMRYETSFAKNILYIIELSIENDHNKVLGRAKGAIHRLRDKIISSIPPEDEIATYRTVKHFRDKKDEKLEENQGIHYSNERISEYILAVYFESYSVMAMRSLEIGNFGAMKDFIREIFRTHYALDKLDPNKYGEMVRRVSYTTFFSLSRLANLSAKKNVSISDEVAVGIQEARDFYTRIDPKLAESYIDLLGGLMIDITEKETPNEDPSSTFYWSGVVLRMSLHLSSPDISIKLLNFFQKVLNIIEEKQKTSLSPLLEKMKDTICDEIVSVRRYEKVDESITKKVDEVLAPYPNVKLKE